MVLSPIVLSTGSSSGTSDVLLEEMVALHGGGAL
jgi:hypothetical protein